MPHRGYRCAPQRTIFLRAIQLAALAIAMLLPAAPVFAYLTFGDLYDTGDGYFRCKWGDNVVGTPGTVTWGFMDDATTPGSDPFFTDQLAGHSRITELRASFDGTYGAGQFNAAIQRAVNTWSAAANITFTYVAADSGLPVNDPNATSPQIRIGAFSAVPGSGFQYVGGIGFAPPPNGGTLEGDIMLNFDNGFQISPGIEDQTPIDFSHGNDLEGQMAHELGHALGLAHPDNNDPLTLPDDVMKIHDFGDPYLVNRKLSADDLGGIRRIYGLLNPLKGDLNIDGVVSTADLQTMLKALTDLPDYQWRMGVSNDDLMALADINDDHHVTNGDLQALITYLKNGGGPLLSVPEPSSALLLLASLAMLGGSFSWRIAKGRKTLRPF